MSRSSWIDVSLTPVWNWLTSSNCILSIHIYGPISLSVLTYPEFPSNIGYSFFLRALCDGEMDRISTSNFVIELSKSSVRRRNCCSASSSGNAVFFGSLWFVNLKHSDKRFSSPPSVVDLWRTPRRTTPDIDLATAVNSGRDSDAQPNLPTNFFEP